MLKVISTAVSSAIFFAVLTSGTLFAAQAFAQSPGNNGTIKVHEYGTPAASPNNDPNVCDFNIEAFNLDAGQAGYVAITVQGNDTPKGISVAPVAFGPADVSGYAASSYFHLADGHYKVTLYGKDTKGAIDYNDMLKAKSKIFKVSCEPVSTTPVKETLLSVNSQPTPSCTPKPLAVDASEAPLQLTTPENVSSTPVSTTSPTSALPGSHIASTQTQTSVLPAELPHTGVGSASIFLTALMGILAYGSVYVFRTDAMRRLFSRFF